MNAARLLAVGRFLRLVDDQNRLSLSNLSVLIALGALVCRKDMGATDAAALVTSLLGYNFKKWLEPDPTDTAAIELRTAVESLQTKVAAIQLANGMKGPR